MKRKMNLATALSLVLAVGCAGVAMAAAPVLQWSLTTPLSGSASVYYGSVVSNTYYTGQNLSGALAYSTTGLQNSFQGDGNIAKAVVKAGNNFYCSNALGGIQQLDGAWTTLSALSLTGIPDAIASDGTNLYGNEYTSGQRNILRRYSISGTTLTADWTNAVSGVARFRGSSYYAAGDLVYSVDQGAAVVGGGVYEVNAATGSATKIISNLDWTGGAATSGYQAVRSGSKIYAVAGVNLYQYGLSGGTWSLLETNDLSGLGSYLYGIGVTSAGDGIWVSTGNQKVSYYTVAVPEPSSVLALASGFIGLVGAAVRRRSA